MLVALTCNSMIQLKILRTKTKHKYPLNRRFRKRSGYQALRTYSTNPTRLMASHSKLMMSHLQGLQKKITRQKKFAFTEKHTLSKPFHNLKILIVMCPQSIRGTLVRRKNMTNPARITAFFLRLWCLHKWRR